MQSPESDDTNDVVNIDPNALLQAYADENSALLHRALMNELAVKSLREQVRQLEHELASRVGPTLPEPDQTG